MGQYYAPVLMAPDSTELKVAATAYSWDFDCGLKLMEHSWVGNPFVRRIESALMGNPMRVVWAGDYADVEPGSGSNLYDDASASLPRTASLRAPRNTSSLRMTWSAGITIIVACGSLRVTQKAASPTHGAVSRRQGSPMTAAAGSCGNCPRTGTTSRWLVTISTRCGGMVSPSLVTVD